MLKRFTLCISLENLNLPCSNMYPMRSLYSIHTFETVEYNPFFLPRLQSGTWTPFAKRKHAFDVTRWRTHQRVCSAHRAASSCSTSILGSRESRPIPSGLYQASILGLWGSRRGPQMPLDTGSAGNISCAHSWMALRKIADLWPLLVCWTLSCLAERMFLSSGTQRSSSWQKH